MIKIHFIVLSLVTFNPATYGVSATAQLQIDGKTLSFADAQDRSFCRWNSSFSPKSFGIEIAGEQGDLYFHLESFEHDLSSEANVSFDFHRDDPSDFSYATIDDWSDSTRYETFMYEDSANCRLDLQLSETRQDLEGTFHCINLQKMTEEFKIGQGNLSADGHFHCPYSVD